MALRILIVDDSPEDCLVYRRLLRQQAWHEYASDAHLMWGRPSGRRRLNGACATTRLVARRREAIRAKHLLAKVVALDKLADLAHGVEALLANELGLGGPDR